MSHQSLLDAFQYQVAHQPDRMAVVFEASEGQIRSCTWRALASRVELCARQLERRFDEQPDLPRRVGHASDNRLADIILALASMSLGAVEVPIDARLGEDEIRRRWNRVGGLWVDAQFRPCEDSLHVFHNPRLTYRSDDIDSASLVLWTSGTTGTPQGVTLSGRNLVGNAAAKLRAVPQHLDDIRLTVLPLSHAYARTCDFGTWLLSGCTLAVTLGHAGFERMAPIVQPTLINTVPSLAIRWLDEKPEGLERLRLLGCGGAAISEQAFGRWQERKVTVIQGYGLTETAPVICSATPDDAAAGLAGRFVDGWESEIRDGQLYVRGPHAMIGYWENQQATAAKIDPDGWLATGDLVELDSATGQIRILGRVDDVIVLESGRKIFPSAIQREVEQISGVQHAILVQRERLQLWFDADDDSPHEAIADQISAVLAKYPNCHDCGVYRFAPQLCQELGELTAKGTIRRAQVLENRFSNA